MSVSNFLVPYKAKPVRLKPSYREGLRIQYLLRDTGENFVGISTRLEIAPPSVRNVVFGRRRSARVEAEIARLLGKTGWNEVVLEARSAVTGKPVETLRQEQAARIDKKAQERERRSASIARVREHNLNRRRRFG